MQASSARHSRSASRPTAPSHVDATSPSSARDSRRELGRARQLLAAQEDPWLSMTDSDNDSMPRSQLTRYNLVGASQDRTSQTQRYDWPPQAVDEMTSSPMAMHPAITAGAHPDSCQSTSTGSSHTSCRSTSLSDYLENLEVSTNSTMSLHVRKLSSLCNHNNVLFLTPCKLCIKLLVPRAWAHFQRQTYPSIVCDDTLQTDHSPMST